MLTPKILGFKILAEKPGYRKTAAGGCQAAGTPPGKMGMGRGLGWQAVRVLPVEHVSASCLPPVADALEAFPLVLAVCGIQQAWSASSGYDGIPQGPAPRALRVGDVEGRGLRFQGSEMATADLWTVTRLSQGRPPVGADLGPGAPSVSLL